MKNIPDKLKTFGSSMSPLLRDGDIVYLNKISFKRARINDVVCVNKNGNLFTHRIIYKSKNFIITKGDSNFLSDGKVYPKQLVGIVKKVKRDNEMFDIENYYLFQSTIYYREIVKVKKELEKARIDMVLLKGLPLHLFFEKSHPRRIYADCDLLIKRADLPRLHKTIKKLGYTYKNREPLIKTVKKSREQEISYYKYSNGFIVQLDIHLEVVFMMTKAGSLNFLYPKKWLENLTNKFLEEKRIIRLHDESFPILSSENLFIYLTLHLFHHNFEGSYRYDFLKSVLLKDRLDYEKVLEVIDNYKLDNFVYPALHILDKYYSVKFPKSFLKSYRKLKIVRAYVKKMDITYISDGKGRIIEGITRFKNIYDFSIAPIYLKLLVFIDPSVIKAIIWIILVRFNLKSSAKK